MPVLWSVYVAVGLRLFRKRISSTMVLRALASQYEVMGSRMERVLYISPLVQ